MDHNKLWKILKEMGIPYHLTWLLRNLYSRQEATVRTGHGATDWFQIGKVHQGCMLSPCLFNLYCRVSHEKCSIGWSTSWNQDCWEKYQEPQICRWHYTYDRKQRRTKEPLDESEEVGLKLNIQKTKIMASGPISSWQIDGETLETVTDFIFLGSKITADGDCSHEIKRGWLLRRKVMTNIDSIFKSRDITLPTKVHLVKAVVLPAVMYGCES